MFSNITNRLLAAVRVLAARNGSWIACDSKVVETKTYSYAIDPATQARTYFSKPQASGLGGQFIIRPVKRGDKHLWIASVDETGRSIGQSVMVPVLNAKALARALASAAMVADPKTGRQQDSVVWAKTEEVARNAMNEAKMEASLFDGI